MGDSLGIFALLVFASVNAGEEAARGTQSFIQEALANQFFYQGVRGTLSSIRYLDHQHRNMVDVLTDASRSFYPTATRFVPFVYDSILILYSQCILLQPPLKDTSIILRYSYFVSYVT
jgi:hypothetical protein